MKGLQYRIKMGYLLKQYQAAHGALLAALKQLEANTTLAYEGQWKSDITFVLDQFLAVGREVRELKLEAPLAFREAHSRVIEIAGHWDTYANQGLKWIEAGAAFEDSRLSQMLEAYKAVQRLVPLASLAVAAANYVEEKEETK